jgi:hypothetical protein
VSAGCTYVYGVVEPGTAAPRTRGIGGRRVTLVQGDGLAALAGAVPCEELKPGSAELTAHARVLERALGHGPVLPMRFGVVMPDEDAVVAQLLEPFREDLLAQLRSLRGKVELHLRAIYEERALMAAVVAAEPRIAARGQALRDTDPDATYYERIELGQLVAGAVERIRVQDEAAILDALAPLAVAYSASEAANERVAADLAFLVEEDALGRFDAAVDDLGRRNDGRIRLRYVGPRPAYSFVELPVEA